MGEHVIKLPDVGEGVAEAELAEWHAKPGDRVLEDAVLAVVMTDKAAVEIPSPANGTVTWLAAEVGDTVAVGAPLVRLEIDSDALQSVAEEAATDDTREAAERPANPGTDEATTVEGDTDTDESADQGDTAQPEATPEPAPPPLRPKARAPAGEPHPTRAPSGAPRPEGERPLASPAVRLRAREAGIDLRQVPGSGSAGRITHEDIDGFFARGATTSAPHLTRRTGIEEVKVIGLRRRIAEKMALAKARIPHITYVEELDVTELETLRAHLNTDHPGRPRLTLLPFLMRAMVNAIDRQPKINALFDDEIGVVHRHAGIHIGVATQTDAGLLVPVVRHAEARDLWDCAAELVRLSEAARNGSATREELSGSTITVSSLGALGGVVTTPIINHPEVAIVGVNKIAVRSQWNGTEFVPRKMMNLSSAFDHRVVDGWDAAIFVQRIKTLLETPAMIFVEG